MGCTKRAGCGTYAGSRNISISRGGCSDVGVEIEESSDAFSGDVVVLSSDKVGFSESVAETGRMVLSFVDECDTCCEIWGLAWGLGGSVSVLGLVVACCPPTKGGSDAVVVSGESLALFGAVLWPLVKDMLRLESLLGLPWRPGGSSRWRFLSSESWDERCARSSVVLLSNGVGWTSGVGCCTGRP